MRAVRILDLPWGMISIQNGRTIMYSHSYEHHTPLAEYAMHYHHNITVPLSLSVAQLLLFSAFACVGDLTKASVGSFWRLEDFRSVGFVHLPPGLVASFCTALVDR